MLAVVLFHLFALFAASASVVGVDFGSRWLKIHVISPGKPIETVLDRESKRKTPNFLAINDGARKFGSEAQHLKDAVRGVELREGLGGASWAKSPALAMIVQYIVDAASKHTGSRITGIVFTVFHVNPGPCVASTRESPALI